MDFKKTWVVLERISDVLLNIKKGCVVEIGIGVSSVEFNNLSLKYGVKYYTCDILGFDESSFKKIGLPEENKKHLHFRGESSEFIKFFEKEIKDIPSIVFLDGSHNYDVVLEEFNFFFKKLECGGIIFIHDTLPPSEVHLDQGRCGDVYRLRQELELMNDVLDCLTWPYTANGCGLTMVIKKENDRFFYRK